MTTDSKGYVARHPATPKVSKCTCTSTGLVFCVKERSVPRALGEWLLVGLAGKLRDE